MKRILYISLLVGAATLVAYPAFAMKAFETPKSSSIRLCGADLSQGAQDFIQKMAERGIDFLGDASLSAEQRKAHFRTLLRSSYDMYTIGRFALGPYWRVASKSQQAEYQRLFENMVVEVYSRRFGDYNGQHLEVRSGRQESDTDVMVTSVIVPKDSGEDPLEVDWRVRNKNGQYKVIDVVVAGVSMALTQRSDFASVIQRGGGDVDALLRELRSGKMTKQASAAQDSSASN